MNQLIIKLTGTVNSSNFDEWKNDLITQIQATNIELSTDADFVEAVNQVKLFKSAEKSLKQAKQSAIEQAEEIQYLFSAIDEITEKARQTRLSLERQIKSRKLEIKNQYIQSGIDEINEFIDKQIPEFKYIDTSIFIDRSRFESAVSGKAGIKGLQAAIDNICSRIKNDISVKLIGVTNNKVKIDSLPEGYKLLFQDWKTLLSLSQNELDLEIDKRIAKYNEQIAQNEAEKRANELKKIENIELNPEKVSADKIKRGPQEKYRILIDLLSTKDAAKEIARMIKENYGDDPSVSEIKLIRNRDE